MTDTQETTKEIKSNGFDLLSEHRHLKEWVVSIRDGEIELAWACDRSYASAVSDCLDQLRSLKGRLESLLDSGRFEPFE